MQGVFWGIIWWDGAGPGGKVVTADAVKKGYVVITVEDNGHVLQAPWGLSISTKMEHQQRDRIL